MNLLLTVLLSCGPGKPDGSDGGSTLDCPTPSTWYVDGDGDGYGSGDPVGLGCLRPTGQVANAEDCDDLDAQVHPGVEEVCNGVDDDCDGSVDPDSAVDIVQCWVDADGDGYGDDARPVLACACTDGLAAQGGDCDDGLVEVHPGVTEQCNGWDDDCDDQVDEGLSGSWYLDGDGDGYGSAKTKVEGCPEAEGSWVAAEGDCNDTDAGINPGALDPCEDEVDQDCDGALYECGFGELTDADDAWWQVYRDSDIRTAGWIGSQLAHGGDADSDGRPEVLAPIVANRCDDGSDPACYTDYVYVLIEAPAGTSGGSFEVGDAVSAAWAVVDDADSYWTATGTSSDHNSIGNVDLDGDGIGDYVLGAAGGWLDSDLSRTPGPSRIDLWYGPPDFDSSLDEPQDLAGAQTLSLDWDVSFEGSVELLVPPESGSDWVLAAGLWPPDDDLEGTDIPTAVLLTSAHFNGDEPVDDATRIWGEPPYGAGPNVEVGDVDADGVLDLALGAIRWGDLPPGRIWIASGPIEADLDLADADYIIEGDEESDFFGITFSMDGDLDLDGRVEVVANQLYMADGGGVENPSVHVYSLSEASAPTTIPFEDAIASLQTVDEGGVAAYSNRTTAPRLVGDVDGDRAMELAVRGSYGLGDKVDDRHECLFLFDTPLAGVNQMSDFSGIVYSDRDMAFGGDFGATMLSGVDYDGDGWPDLVVGEGWWTSSITDYTPYGRFHVFRGAVGGS